MFTVDLKCENGHEFEGWYGNQGEYQEIVDHDELTCPYCETHKVSNTLRTGAPVTSKRAAKQEREKVQWVGDRFADEAVAMWQGEKPSQSIVGTADDPRDRKKLSDAGVPTFAVLHPVEEPDPHDIN
jgi:hypothetical protein